MFLKRGWDIVQLIATHPSKKRDPQLNSPSHKYCDLSKKKNLLAYKYQNNITSYSKKKTTNAQWTMVGEKYTQKNYNDLWPKLDCSLTYQNPINWSTDFVCRSMHKLCSKARRWIIWVGNCWQHLHTKTKDSSKNEHIHQVQTITRLPHATSQ